MKCGSVGLMYGPIDGAAEAYIAWEPFASELLAEMRERIRS